MVSRRVCPQRSHAAAGLSAARSGKPVGVLRKFPGRRVPLAGAQEPPKRPVRCVFEISCLSVQMISFVSTFTQSRISR